EKAYPYLARLPVEGIGVDFVRAPENEELIAGYGKLAKTLFAGVVDGRNVWINDLDASLVLLRRLGGFAEEIAVSTSCSLLHVPLDIEEERGLPEEVRPWLAFARQKVREVVLLARALNEGDETVSYELEDRRAALAARAASGRTRNPEVRRRLAALEASDASRYAHYPHRRKRQRVHLGLPRFPTTTTGSFPQTPQIRKARARLQASEINREAYQKEMKAEIERVVRFQEEAGLDVLVHGEAERNDMVQYFAEELDGFVLTKKGWVQSFGNRYVRPPIIVGDISRPAPMTLEWITYAQSLTGQPMKGMLTGPVTMLMWSFVRDDQPRSETCKQLALAVREEVADLEKVGIRVIQVDEPALREGLPLRRARWGEYVAWATYCFRLATSCVADDTQIQTHMCYSAFADVIDAIDALDADVLLIEHSRSSTDLLEDFSRSHYEREIGVGVYDVHSPRVPSVEEMAAKLEEAAKILAADQIWVVPDCGLKTRTWDEVRASLENMVEAAKLVRARSDPKEEPGNRAGRQIGGLRPP
ncbi:MAG: 5-methyltetrahydropteroyltriglutamate--homocysteine S-methyltransferase, partial [Actinomycetota bacterium]